MKEKDIYNLKKTQFSRDKKKTKLIQLQKNGFNFPNIFKTDNNIKNLINLYAKYSKDKLKKLNILTSITGRIITKRILGKASFFLIQNDDEKIQIYIKSNSFSQNYYEDYVLHLDTGDIIGIVGTVFKTNTNEFSLFTKKIILLTKTLRTLPDKYYGLKDKEIKYRKRYLDLIINLNVKKIFQKRSKILQKIRIFMEKKNFLEVETPMMHSISGGANAKPFITYHNELNRKMYLRVAPELYLKRLVIGGFNKIFEINRNFRNEGISSRHNPEFTMMEIYMAYSTYKDMIHLLEDLLNFLSKSIFNSLNFLFNKYKVNLKKPFKKITMIESILKYNLNITESDLNDIEKAKEKAKDLNLTVPDNLLLGEIIYLIFEKTVEKKLIEPTFITEYPIEVSPLAKTKQEKKNFTERFEFFLCGYEIANGFSELNDPIEQKKRFKNQIIKKNKKKSKTIEIYDKDYIIALEHGLPPTSGLGIGIDRLVMIFTNQNSIKDVILFPTLKDNINY